MVSLIIQVLVYSSSEENVELFTDYEMVCTC